MAAGDLRKKRRRSVGGMVVHDNHVEGKIGPLRERAVHRVGHGPDAVPDGDDDARLQGKRFGGGRHITKFGREPGPDPLEMRRCRGLHLLLERPVPGIDVGEVSPAARAGLRRGCLDQGEPLREMEEIVIGGDLETEIVPAGPPVCRYLPVFPDRPAGGGPRKKDQGAEVEAVAQAPRSGSR